MEQFNINDFTVRPFLLENLWNIFDFDDTSKCNPYKEYQSSIINKIY